MTARREWTPEECKDAYAEAITYPSTIAEGVGRALLTLRQERNEARAALELLRAEVRAWRAFDYENWPGEVDADGKCAEELRAARAATDAAGALEEGA